MKIFLAAATLVLLAGALPGSPRKATRPQEQKKIAVDPETGRAVGAREMTPEEVRKLVDRKTNTLIIDVRNQAQFEKETIKGAIHIPFDQLESKLKDLPKDVTLVFT